MRAPGSRSRAARILGTVSTDPLRVRLLNDYDIILSGLRTMLEPFSHRVRVVESDVRESSDRAVDVTLYDTFAGPEADRDDVEWVLRDPDAGAVVVYTWNVQHELVRDALDRGFRGYAGKNLRAEELVGIIEAVAAGRIIAEFVDADDEADPAAEARSEMLWPGRAEGLTAREAEVVAFITQGLSNAEIAARSYITMNSLKTYIRSAYRKMGVERRAQAVRWGMEHGMLPPRTGSDERA